MTLHRDQIVGGVLLLLAGGALALSGDLPVGTLGSPGPGLVPMLAIALVAAFSIALIVSARSSPPAAETHFEDLRHALPVVIAAALALLVYEWLGFVITMLLLLVGLLLRERIEAWRALVYAGFVVSLVKLVLGKLLKAPLPIGPFGF